MTNASLERINVLLIEDDSDDALLVEQALTHDESNCAVEHVSTFAEGMRYVDEGCFDVALVDLSLPDSSGLGGIVDLRERSPSLPIIVITGIDDNGLAIEALERGAQDYLVKGDWSGRELRRSINHAIQRQQIHTENSLLVNELQRLARHDPLTGLLNRKAFKEGFEREWIRSLRKGSDLSCVILDVDFFKKFNDTYGHAVGDEVLKNVTSQLEDGARPSDILGRYGGEEFCIVLPNTPEKGAMAWAERMRVRVAASRLRIGDESLAVTASFGVAQKLKDTASPDELIDLADQALLLAKQSGRDRVVAFAQMQGLQDARSLARDNMWDRIRVSDVMSPVVVCLSESEPLSKAANLLLHLRVDSVPVVNASGDLAGILGEEDLVNVVSSLDSWSESVGSAMKTRPPCFDADTPATVVVEFLGRVSLRRVIITNDRRPVGTVSRGSILRWFQNAQLAALCQSPAVGEDKEAPATDSKCLRVVQCMEEEIAALKEHLGGGPSSEGAHVIVGAATRIQELTDEALATLHRESGAAASFGAVLA